MITKTLIIFFLLAASSQSYGEYRPIWTDEFNYVGTVDVEKWDCETGYLRNDEKQYYSDRLENVRVDGENLIIEVRKEHFNGYGYTSGSIHTRNKFSFLYGKIEVRAKISDGDGSGPWPAIWTTGRKDCKLGWPACGEIDIMEYVGNTPGIIHGTVHYGLNEHYSSTSTVANINVEEYHIYSVEWTSDSIKWYLDGVEYHHFNMIDEQELGYVPLRLEQTLRLNLALGGTWGGHIDDSILPVTYTIDYIRVYKDVNNNLLKSIPVILNFLTLTDD